MAREPEKSAREIGKAKTEATAGSKERRERTKRRCEIWFVRYDELLKAQHRELQAMLAKRSDANADREAIVKEFAAAWLPHIAVEQEVLIPALEDAGIDEEKLAAVVIQRTSLICSLRISCAARAVNSATRSSKRSQNSSTRSWKARTPRTPACSPLCRRPKGQAPT